MPKIKYIDKTFMSGSMNIIDQANVIITDYMAQGFKLTLRQLYYRFIAGDLFPESWRDSQGTKNNQKNYDKLGSIINDARLAGLVDWEAIEDRTRNLRSLSHWDSPNQILSACAQQYRIDKWADQTYRPEVFIEKDALVGVISGICEQYDVPYFSCRGYSSQSEMWAAGQRLEDHINNGQTPIILHLGDHDPSGNDMTRDIRERLKLFMGGTEVRRLALNYDQVQQFNPPPSPAKITDSRAAAYIASFGNDSWELDSMEPQVLVDLIEDAILSLRNDAAWEKSVKTEIRARNKIKKVAKTI